MKFSEKALPPYPGRCFNGEEFDANESVGLSVGHGLRVCCVPGNAGVAEGRSEAGAREEPEPGAYRHWYLTSTSSVNANGKAIPVSNTFVNPRGASHSRRNSITTRNTGGQFRLEDTHREQQHSSEPTKSRRPQMTGGFLLCHPSKTRPCAQDARTPLSPNPNHQP